MIEIGIWNDHGKIVDSTEENDQHHSRLTFIIITTTRWSLNLSNISNTPEPEARTGAVVRTKAIFESDTQCGSNLVTSSTLVE